MNRFESVTKPLKWFMALLLVAIVAGCGGGNGSSAPISGDTVAPTVTFTTPVNNATAVPINRKITASFSEAMSTATINTATFKVAAGASAVTGTVTLDATSKIATFTPASNLTVSTPYTATITTAAKDLAGNALASNKVWTFTTDASTAGDTTKPTVSSTIPVDAASGVAINSNVYATFSEPMDPATITATNFTVAESGVPASTVSGAVSYIGATATFNPTANLAASTAYTATIKGGVTGVTDIAAPGNAMLADKTWSFTTGTAPAAGPLPVDLGTSANYVILSKTGVSTTGATAVVGNVGVSPIARVGLTGWALQTEPTDTFFTSTYVTAPGKLYAADQVGGTTSADLGTAILDMGTAYTDAAGRAAGVTELYAGDISGQTLAPGVYKWSSGVLITSGVTLSGTANDVWIFQIAQNLTVSSGAIVTLSGALPKNIFWQVAGQTTLGTGADFKGIILDKTAVVLQTGAVLNGRALAQTAVTLNANPVTQPAP
ncbi:MAG: ice-binding family protein [Gallionella sp.]